MSIQTNIRTPVATIYYSGHKRTLPFTAEKLGKFTCEVCRKDCRGWDGTHCNLLLYTDGANTEADVTVVIFYEDIFIIEIQIICTVVLARTDRT